MKFYWVTSAYDTSSDWWSYWGCKRTKNMESMLITNDGLHHRLLEQEQDIEIAQRRSDILKEKLNNIEAIVGNNKLPAKVMRTQIITEIKK